MEKLLVDCEGLISPRGTMLRDISLVSAAKFDVEDLRHLLYLVGFMRHSGSARMFSRSLPAAAR